MIKHKRRGPNQLFIETKLGIVTRTGDWFHTSREQIEEYVPGLLEMHSLEKLISEAHGWVRSADSLTLSLLMGLLFLVNPWLAALCALTFHWFWYNYKSAFVSSYLGRLFDFMNRDGYFMVISLIALSFLGITERYLAVGIGIIFFFLLKLGLLNRLWNKLKEEKEAALTLNDRVLNMIIVKYAIRENIAPESVQKMEDQIRRMAAKRHSNNKEEG